jgi:multidrug resistance efflux pump
LNNLDLKAPFNGTVVDVNVSNGQLVGSDTWAVLVADFSEWYVDSSDLTEQEVVNISMGQKATVSPDAMPDQHLTSQVTEIADMFNVQSCALSCAPARRSTGPQFQVGHDCRNRLRSVKQRSG